jgi:hypothetical protein
VRKRTSSHEGEGQACQHVKGRGSFAQAKVGRWGEDEEEEEAEEEAEWVQRRDEVIEPEGGRGDGAFYSLT